MFSCSIDWTGRLEFYIKISNLKYRGLKTIQKVRVTCNFIKKETPAKYIDIDIGEITLNIVLYVGLYKL